MSLTYTELESCTNDYFAADGKKAVDIYFNTSFLLNKFMKQQGGLWERPNGGNKIRVPLEYDESEGGFFTRSDTLSSDDREIVNAAEFLWKHVYGNATIYEIDEIKNAGVYAQVSLVTTKISSAQKTATKHLAESIYDANGDTSKYLTGLGSMCSETAGTPYGGIEEEDLEANDGTLPWEGKTTTTTEVISLDVIRTLRTLAKLYDGKNGKPDFATTTEALFNKIKSILQPMQRFTEDKETTKVGFTNLVFEGMLIAADDYSPSGYFNAINSNHYGFAIHKKGYFKRAKWQPLADKLGRTMKIVWHGNAICNNRKSHARHSNLS